MAENVVGENTNNGGMAENVVGENTNKGVKLLVKTPTKA